MSSRLVNRLSRRAFLKRSGAAAFWGLGAGTLSTTASAAPSFSFPESMGRALARTGIYAGPDESSPVGEYLAPDSTMPILARSGEDWYQVPGGYVRREAMQPILPYSRPVLIETVGEGAWAEVVVPSSAVRAWCAGSAPVMARLGFGAVVYVVDRLTDDHGLIWYGLAAAPGSPLVGWASALHYTAWMPEAFPANIQLRIQRGELLIEDGAQIITRIDITGPELPTGQNRLYAVQPGAAFSGHSSSPVKIHWPLGLPWLMRLDSGPRLYGVWWHNRFGSCTDVGPDIELPVLAARWLYAWLVCHDSTTMLIIG